MLSIYWSKQWILLFPFSLTDHIFIVCLYDVLYLLLRTWQNRKLDNCFHWFSVWIMAYLVMLYKEVAWSKSTEDVFIRLSEYRVGQGGGHYVG